MKIIDVPDIEHPTYCYKQAITMERCTRPKDHRGYHTWEPESRPITDLNYREDGKYFWLKDK